jgi:hypothetical protein
VSQLFWISHTLTNTHKKYLSESRCSHIPRYGWQIDPFGLSNVVHEQFAWMGFNATVLGRVQSGLKADLIANKSLEMVWQTSASLGESSQV